MSKTFTLEDYRLLDDRAWETISEVVGGLDNSIAEMEKKVKLAIMDPMNLFVLPIVLKTHLDGYDKHYSEISAFAAKLIHCRESIFLKNLGFDFNRETIRYQQQVNNIWGVYKRDPHDLIMSLQFRLKEGLEKQKIKIANPTPQRA